MSACGRRMRRWRRAANEPPCEFSQTRFIHRHLPAFFAPLLDAEATQAHKSEPDAAHMALSL